MPTKIFSRIVSLVGTRLCDATFAEVAKNNLQWATDSSIVPAMKTRGFE
jgi:hypothetical protein